MIAKRHTLANALIVAADQYEQDAAFFSPAKAAERGEILPLEARARFIACFEKQAADARKLAADIEQSSTIDLED